MSDAFTTAQANTVHTAPTAGFVVARLWATTDQRVVIVDGYVNGQLVASASATDSSVPGVHSARRQSFTIPVPVGGNYEVRIVEGSNVAIHWFPNL